MKQYIFILLVVLMGCQKQETPSVYYPDNILDYSASPNSSTDRSALAFSDQGAWFAYGLPKDGNNRGGFAGPFLMTEQNGVWSSPTLCKIALLDVKSNQVMDLSEFEITQKSYPSHLEQIVQNESVKLTQKLFFSSAHTAFIINEVENMGKDKWAFQWNCSGKSYLKNLHFSEQKDGLKISSDLSPAEGHLLFHQQQNSHSIVNDSAFVFSLNTEELKPGKTARLIVSQSFIFPEYDWQDERAAIAKIAEQVDANLQFRIAEKQQILQGLYDKMDTAFQSEVYKNVLVKTYLTLQNNWRSSAGELKYSGLFPSYHYKWFHGFWAWDSWKHAVALAEFDTHLAKDQIRVMYDFMDEEGFIVDCIYRDTMLEHHNYRNTKPPLSAWAVWKVFEQDGDSSFVKEMYAKVKKQHEWWYIARDHDSDGLCEYGSTDGTLIAAKWESGMDNAVRFDDSQILQNSSTAWSLNQESVDLNAYLYAEKNYLAQMARILNKTEEEQSFLSSSKKIKSQFEQFFNKEKAWFYDISLDGEDFINVKGCEAWIPLWAGLATNEQAASIKETMMDPKHFNIQVPLQTLSASHEKFKPNGGYWRGPVWLDQSYFGVEGLKNYGYKKEALLLTQKLINNAEGLTTKGPSIRENYQPLTGEGLESESFSWSAGHYMLLLLEE